MLKNAGNQLIRLTQSDTPNYKVAAAASSILALIYMSSSLEGGYVSNYLSLAGLLFTAGITVRQYGLQKAYQNITNSIHGLFKPTKTNANVQYELAEIPTDTLKKNK